MNLVVFTTIIALILIQDSTQQCLNPNEQGQPNPTGQADFYFGQQDFALELLNATSKLAPTKNLLFSPYSMYHALLIAYFMAGGKTESYLKKTLKLSANQQKSDIYALYKLDVFMTKFVAEGAPYEFTTANKIYVSNDTQVRECILAYFPNELELFPFRTDPEGSRLGINQWVESTTHSMINNFLPPGSTDSTTNLVLVSAAYFKGIWEKKFNPIRTKPEIFYVSPSRQIVVDIMNVEGKFRHAISESLGAHILELPYQGDNISMFILLPTTEGSVDATMKNLNLEKFKKVVNKGTLVERIVQVALPKFSLETTTELAPGNLFKKNANFNSLTRENLVLDEGIHKAKIELNEYGAYAAAGAAFLGDEQEMIRFRCDRPFIYFIYNGKAILFIGIFRSP